MANIIRGIGGQTGSGNDAYRVGRGKIVPRPQLVREVVDGKHPNHHVVVIGGVQYVRGNPDSSTGNNVND